MPVLEGPRGRVRRRSRRCRDWPRRRRRRGAAATRRRRRASAARRNDAGVPRPSRRARRAHRRARRSSEPTTTVVVHPGGRSTVTSRRLPAGDANDAWIEASAGRRTTTRRARRRPDRLAASRTASTASCREMTNTLLRRRARGHQHGPRLLMLRRHRRQRAARRRPRACRCTSSALECRPRRCAAPRRPRRGRRVPRTTTPTSATRTPPITRILVPVFIDGEHLLHRARRRPIRPTAATRCRPPTCRRRRRLRGGRAHLPLRSRAARLPGRRRHHPHVPGAHPGARPLVRRLPGGARRGQDRRAPAQGAVRQVRRRDPARFIADWLDYCERRMDEAIAQLPGGPLDGSTRP